MGRVKEKGKGEEGVKLSEARFAKYAAVTMFLNYRYYHRVAVRVKRVCATRAAATIITARTVMNC